MIRRLLKGLQRRFNRYLSVIDQWIAERCRSSGFMASIYYALFSRKFDREHKSVLFGRWKYRQIQKQPTESSALLRRNIHRLEKGLLMRPRRDLFALAYIGETVECYRRMVLAVGGLTEVVLESRPDLSWSRDVLTEFFAVTQEHPETDAFRRIISDIEEQLGQVNRAEKMIPYLRKECNRPNISIEDMKKLAKFRRSVRWFADSKVPRDAIDHAIEVANQSPSACNRQPFRFHIIDDPILVQKVSSIPMGTVGYAKNIPTLLVIIGSLSNYPFERDRHVIYIDGSLAAMALIFGLEVQGLSSCCINWPDMEAKEKIMAQTLKLEPDERPVMCLAIGYPDPQGMVAYSTKKTLREIRRYNFE